MARITIALLAAIAAVAAAGYGLLLRDDAAAPPIVIEDPRPDATVVVAVEGAVASPGVFALPGDDRVGDALAAAGGAAADADLAAVNLARRLRDEDRIVVPTTIPTPSVSVVSETGSTVAPTVPVPAAPPVGDPSIAKAVPINVASPEELDRLPGIGPVLAERIVAYRTANGPFRELDDLEQVQGISSRMVEDLRPLVSLEP